MQTKCPQNHKLHPLPSHTPQTTLWRQHQKRTHQKALQILISFENLRRLPRKRKNLKKGNQREMEPKVKRKRAEGAEPKKNINYSIIMCDVKKNSDRNWLICGAKKGKLPQRRSSELLTHRRKFFSFVIV